MTVEIRDLLRVHSCALSGHDVETLASLAAPEAACFCDGEWVGEGPEGVRRLLEQEYARQGEFIARVEEEPGGPVVVEFSLDGRERRGRVRIGGDHADGRIRELHVEHGPLVRAGVPEPGR